MEASKKLELLVITALRAKVKADAAALAYKEAQKAVMSQLIEEDMFNPDTKAIGPVRLAITPNRYFDLDTAITLVSEDVVEECKVTVIDAKLLQENMTPKQKELAMKDHEVPLKLGFKVDG